MITIDTNLRLSSILGPVLGAFLALARIMWLVLLTAAQLVPRPVFALDAPTEPRPPITAPLPPIRPTGRAAVPVPAQSPPTPASPAMPMGASTLPADPPSQPKTLPPASRKRMHECGLEWRKMKESGATADKIWFDFAQACLTK